MMTYRVIARVELTEAELRRRLGCKPNPKWTHFLVSESGTIINGLTDAQADETRERLARPEGF